MEKPSLNQNKISFRPNGVLEVWDPQRGNQCINTLDPADVINKLPLLDEYQIRVLTDLINQLPVEIAEELKSRLQNQPAFKNIIMGNISNVHELSLGDNIHIDGDIYVIYYANKPIIPKALTVKIPRTSRDRIIGRDAELEDLHQRLFSNQQVVLVNGMGGIGKTTLAQVYIDYFWHEYAHIAWITQSSEDIRDDFVSAEGLIENLNIPNNGEIIKNIFIQIMNKFNRINDKPNLLVIDNANESLEQIYDYLPHKPIWHVLATSRYQLNRFDIKELDFLSSGEAVELFLLHYKNRSISEKEIVELVSMVDRNTLAIEILSKTAQKQRLSLGTLKGAIEKDIKANVYINHKGGMVDCVASYINRIFSLSELIDNEIWLLKQIACLPAEFHSYHMLKDLIKPEYTQRDDIFSETITELNENGWLLKNQDSDSYKMHTIIAEVIKQQTCISLAEVMALVQSITDKLSSDQSKDNPIVKFPWISYGLSIINVFADNEDVMISTLKNNLALRLMERGDYEEAKNLLLSASFADVKNFGVDHRNTVTKFANLALVLEKLGDYQRAKIFLEEAVRVAEKCYGSDYPETAIWYSNLASIHEHLGDYVGAKALLEKAVIADEATFGADHPATARRYSNLAIVLKDLGDFQGAKALLEKAVHSYEKYFDADNPAIGVVYSNLASVLQTIGDYQGAKILFEKAVRSSERSLGMDHPTTSVNYSNLANLLDDLGDYREAKSLLEKAILTDEKKLGDGHPDTALKYSNLASVLEHLGDYQGAKTLLEKAKQSSEKYFGPDHPDTVLMNSKLAMIHLQNGDYQVALNLLEQAVLSAVKSFGPNHPTTSLHYSQLAMVLQSVGDYHGARDLFEKVIHIAEKSYGIEHQNTAIAYSNFAMILKDFGDYQKALAFAQKAIDILSLHLPIEHPTFKTISDNYKSIIYEMGN